MTLKQHTSSKQHNIGYTLIELLVVMSIIALLSAAGLASYNGTQKYSRDARRREDLRTLQLALEQYYTNNGSYPSTSGAWWGEPLGFGSHKTDYIPGLVPTYIKALPNDPRASQTYPPCNDGGSTGYLYRSDGVDYKVVAHCSPEGNYGTATSNSFYDPLRPTWGWQVSTPGAAGW